MLPPTPDAVVDPMCARAVDDAAELLRSLGHEVEQVDPPWQSDGLSELFGAVFSTQISLSIAYSGIVAGRGVDGISEDDMEPMSWAIYSMVKPLGAVEGMAAVVRLQAFTRNLVSFLSPYDVLLTPALAERPLPLGTLDTAAPDPMAHLLALGPVHALHADLQRERPARHLAAALSGRGRSAAGRAARRSPSRRGGAAGAR